MRHPFKYQRVAIDIMAENLRNHEPTLLADLPGLGKTGMMLMAVKEAGFKKAAIICPTIAASVWRHEAKEWLGKYDPKAMPIFTYPEFSLGKAENDFLNFIGGDTAVLIDECHYLKTLGSKRTQAVYGGIAMRGVHAIIAASGTPAPNHYGEMYPLFFYLWPNLIRGKTSGNVVSQAVFENTFCIKEQVHIKGGRMVEVIRGSKNAELMRVKLKGIMIRRRPEQVLQDMPELIFDTLPLDIPELKDTKEDSAVYGMTDAEVLEYARKSPPERRQEVGLAKVDDVVEHVCNELEPDPKRKIVLFAVHHAVIDALVERLKQFKPVKIDGRDSVSKRDSAIEAFQNGDSQVFVGQIVASGVSITLTNSRDVLFVESDYVPGNNFQAAKRCHRIGQAHNVLVRHVVAAGTIDERIAEILARKEAELADVFDFDKEKESV